MKSLAICSLILLIAAPTIAQAPAGDSDFQNLFSGKVVPITLKLKDLTPEWRHVIIEKAEGSISNDSDLLNQLMLVNMTYYDGRKSGDEMTAMVAVEMIRILTRKGSGEIPSYTQGLTKNIGGETFLIAYQAPVKESSYMDLFIHPAKYTSKGADYRKMLSDIMYKPETELSLTLINLRYIGKLNGNRPFDLNREIEESSKQNSLLDTINKEDSKEEDKSEDDSSEKKDASGATPAPSVKLSAKLQSFHNSALNMLASNPTLKKASTTFELNFISESSLKLDGTVPNAQLKTRAENLIRKLMKQQGLSFQLENNIKVASPADKE